MGYSVYYDGELKVSPSLSEQHAALVTALVNQEQTDETRVIFAAFAAQPERNLPFHGGLLSVSEDRQLLVPEKDESRHGLGLWLRLLIDYVFVPLGYTLSGEVTWEGEDRDDAGTIFLNENDLEIVDDLIFNAGPSWAPNHFVDETLKTELRRLLDSADSTGCTSNLAVVESAPIEAIRSLLNKI